MKKLFVLSLLVFISLSTFAQNPTIEKFTTGMEREAGLFTYYLDNNEGRIWLEVTDLNEEFLYINSLTAGLGSNDVGLDRNKLGDTKIVSFKRFGSKLLLIESNYGFRAQSSNPDEVKAVTDAFASSVIYGFKISAVSGSRLLVDATEFIINDSQGIPSTLRRSNQGDYKQDMSRSAIYTENTRNFPLNTEFESIITFTSSSPGNYVRSVAPDAGSITLRQHHSFVKLPDSNYTPREWDPRSSYGAISYMDFATPIDQEITKRFIRRHRLEKKDPSAFISDPVEPIIYYVDRGAPEPIRSALIEGASWWNQAFEAAGYRSAFQVKLLPEGADPMDVRYNMINWIHRSTRGWSYGSSVTDPRTGEIIKGHIALGSQRVRQDFLIASGLVAEYEEGKELNPEIMEMALLRIRQLSCHEVGHTLGLNHNYAASATGRASVMDYPHPLVEIVNGELSLSNAYTKGIGDWDKVSIAYGYQDFPDGTNVVPKLREILDSAFISGQVYLTDQDSRGTNPNTHVWDNGSNPIDELERVMRIRAIAMKNFDLKKIPPGSPLSTLEEVFVPVYLFHRYQITAAASTIGGLYYNHNIRGGAQALPVFVPAAEQNRALDALLKVISPENLVISETILGLIPPRTPGLRNERELFPGYTGIVFDQLAAAENIAEITVSELLDPERAARMLSFAARDNNLPSFENLVDRLIDKTWRSKQGANNLKELERTVKSVVLNKLIILAADKRNAPQVRAIAHRNIKYLKTWIEARNPIMDKENEAHLTFSLDLINFYLENPDRIVLPASLPVPDGAPIGSY